jgi:Xaa-Pro aminopeptidase
MRKIYNVVLEAQTAAIEGYRPGMTGGDVDRIARDVIKEAGYGEYFGHGLGHGVGIDVHEAPNVSPKGSTVLEPGMIFSIEPGIYVPDLGGVRIEDHVTIENGSLRVITKSPAKELTVL